MRPRSKLIALSLRSSSGREASKASRSWKITSNRFSLIWNILERCCLPLRRSALPFRDKSERVCIVKMWSNFQSSPVHRVLFLCSSQVAIINLILARSTTHDHLPSKLSPSFSIINLREFVINTRSIVGLVGKLVSGRRINFIGINSCWLLG